MARVHPPYLNVFLLKDFNRLIVNNFMCVLLLLFVWLFCHNSTLYMVLLLNVYQRTGELINFT